MELQRQYTPEVLEQYEIDKAKAEAAGVEPNRPPASHVWVKHTGTSPEQNFSTRFFEAGLIEGWLRMVDNGVLGGQEIVIRAECDSGMIDLVYKVKRTPGYYCVSTGDRIPISQTAWASPRRGELASKEAKAWLAARGLPERDYEVTNAYECVLDPDQHESFKKG